LISVRVAPERMGMGMMGPVLGRGTGGAGGTRLGGCECAWGSPTSMSMIRMAGSDGNGMTDTRVESICSTPVRSANVAPTVAKAPSASPIASTMSPRPSAWAARESPTADMELECQSPVIPASTAASSSRSYCCSEPTGSSAKPLRRSDIPS
jgi:hypothetical protein